MSGKPAGAARAAAAVLAVAGCSSGATSTSPATVTTTETVTSTATAVPAITRALTSRPTPPPSPAGTVRTVPGGTAATATTTPAATATESSVPDPTSASAPARTGCAATGGAVPIGVVHRRVVDVDGDGRPDTLWVTPAAAAGSVRIGISTASGATFTTTFTSGSPGPRSVLVARPILGGPVVVLATDGRATGLLTVVGCALRTVTDIHGSPYVFDVADLRGGGTGVGCVGPGNRVGLTGLNAASTNGRRFTITRTFVTVTATVARNGATDTVHAVLPRDHVEIDGAHTLTCGTRTLNDDGVSLTR